jgi:hypothetical protein
MGQGYKIEIRSHLGIYILGAIASLVFSFAYVFGR